MYHNEHEKLQNSTDTMVMIVSQLLQKDLVVNICNAEIIRLSPIT